MTSRSRSDRDGTQIAAYTKIHLFDVDVGGISYRESDGTEAGSQPVVADIDGVRFGLTVCYDLRFPELYRTLALEGGATVLTVPSNFTLLTGMAHWELLLRARAVENQAFVLATGQHGYPGGLRKPSYGHSMIIDPWGRCSPRRPTATASSSPTSTWRRWRTSASVCLPSATAARTPTLWRWLVGSSTRAWTHSRSVVGRDAGGAAPRRLRDRRRLGPRSRASALDRLNRRIASSSVAPMFRPNMHAPCVLALLGSQPPRTSRELPSNHLEEQRLAADRLEARP